MYMYVYVYMYMYIHVYMLPCTVCSLLHAIGSTGYVNMEINVMEVIVPGITSHFFSFTIHCYLWQQALLKVYPNRALFYKISRRIIPLRGLPKKFYKKGHD